MLNRRILRVKAMQALYSYFTAQESLKDVVRERLESNFYPDPAKDDFTEAHKFTARRKQASELFNSNLISRAIPLAEEVTEDIREEVEEHINHYHQELSKEKRNIRNRMIGDIDDIKKLYFKMLALPIEIAHLELVEKDKSENAHIVKESPWKWNFIKNPLIDKLTKYEDFTKTSIDLKISWQEDIDDLRGWYKEILKKDETLIAYQAKSDPTPEGHKEAILYFFKKIIFKNETLLDFLSEQDLHWSENKSVVKSLVVKTFQDYEEDLDPAYELKEVIKNAEDDLEFFETLFDQTLEEDDELYAMIEKKVKNWDISRVALTDLIILKMAITEMRHFHGIPVKVTINEFIEISKIYSTPKSKQFVNGILDVLVNELTSEGVIRKSGRGLIDNK